MHTTEPSDLEPSFFKVESAIEKFKRSVRKSPGTDLIAGKMIQALAF
jgi:hypothetical protein